jgi:hypothetical protein
MHVAKKHLDEYRQSVLFGHVHTSQLYYTGGLGVKQVGASHGHLADVNSKGMQYAKKTGRWIQGWAIIYEEVQTGNFWIELLNLYDHKLIHAGRIY